MNTDYIYISNIPSNIKPVLLLRELNNKWARMLYLENSFSGMRDALVYNPVKNPQDLQAGVELLKSKDIDGVKSLSVSYVFFPPTNVFLTTMIPEGASMLSYILLENINKDVIPPEVIMDLPLQATDLKPWDIPERSDKCLLVKLPLNCTNPMRSLILGALRSRMIRGIIPKVSELIISETPNLNGQMVPRSLRLLDSGESYQSNFFYLHDIPSRVTVKMLVEITKSEHIKGSRVFFLETNNNMKYGFLYVPKSLPNDRFMGLYEKMRDSTFQVGSSDEHDSIKIAETWFQPNGSDVPSPQCSNGLVNEEMILSDYAYLARVPPNVSAQQLIFGCPIHVKLSLFSVNEIETQLGFLLLRGLNEMQCTTVIEHFRSINFNGLSLEVTEIYLRIQDAPNINERPFQLIPRQKNMANWDIANETINQTMRKRVLDSIKDEERAFVTPSNGSGWSGVTTLKLEDLVLVQLPDDECSLMKTDFLCVDCLPRNVGMAALLFNVGKTSDGAVMIPAPAGNKVCIYFPDCGGEEWIEIIYNLMKRSFNNRRAVVHEVYLQTAEYTSDLSSDLFVYAPLIFLYNIAKTAEISDIYNLDTNLIAHAELLKTANSGSKSAFILLHENCDEHNMSSVVTSLRKSEIHGKPLYADPIKLAPVKDSLKKRRI